MNNELTDGEDGEIYVNTSAGRVKLTTGPYISFGEHPDSFKLTKTPSNKPPGFQWVQPVVGVDYGSEPSTTVVYHKCALCGVMFKPDSDKQFIAAHAKVCEKRPLEVGERVRVERCGHDRSSNGKIGMILRTDQSALQYLVMLDERSASHGGHVWCEDVRRIPRQVDEVTPVQPRTISGLTPHSTSAQIADAMRGAGWNVAWADEPSSPVPDPLDVKYDGVTLRDLLVVDEARRRERDIGPIPWRNVDPWTWTTAQHAAVSAHWSAELRRKVAESKERDRNQVVVDVDFEPEPW